MGVYYFLVSEKRQTIFSHILFTVYSTVKYIFSKMKLLDTNGIAILFSLISAGNSLCMLGTKDTESCAKICDATKGCYMWTFNLGSNGCYLKKRPSGGKPNKTSCEGCASALREWYTRQTVGVDFWGDDLNCSDHNPYN